MWKYFIWEMGKSENFLKTKISLYPSFLWVSFI